MPLPSRLGNECPKFIKFIGHELVGKVTGVRYGITTDTESYDQLIALTGDGVLMIGATFQFESVGDEVMVTI